MSQMSTNQQPTCISCIGGFKEGTPTGAPTPEKARGFTQPKETMDSPLPNPSYIFCLSALNQDDDSSDRMRGSSTSLHAHTTTGPRAMRRRPFYQLMLDQSKPRACVMTTCSVIIHEAAEEGARNAHVLTRNAMAFLIVRSYHNIVSAICKQSDH